MLVLDRIKMLTGTDERFTIPTDFSLDDFMRHSFKVMHDELYTVGRSGVKPELFTEWERGFISHGCVNGVGPSRGTFFLSELAIRTNWEADDSLILRTALTMVKTSFAFGALRILITSAS